MKYRFNNPLMVVEVSTSPLDKPERGNNYTIFDCLCRPYNRAPGPRKKYEITASSAASAARMANANYKSDFKL